MYFLKTTLVRLRETYFTNALKINPLEAGEIHKNVKIYFFVGTNINISFDKRRKSGRKLKEKFLFSGLFTCSSVGISLGEKRDNFITV